MTELYTDVRMDLRIDYAANRPAGKMDGVHYHDAYEIYVLEKGERNHLIDGTRISLAAREVALIKPFALHTTDGSAYSRYVLYFKEAYLDRYFSPVGKAVLLSLFEEKKLTLTEEAYARTVELLLALNGRHEDFLLLAEILHLLLAARERLTECAEGDGSLIARITEYLRESYLDFRGLDELAARFFVTKFYLCRLFKRETGLSVVSYVNAQKIRRACEELRYTRKSVKRIAADCGFSSSVYFCKLFREGLGTSPLEYRRMHQI